MKYLRVLLIVFLGWGVFQTGQNAAGPALLTGASITAPPLQTLTRRNLHQPVTFVVLGDTVMHLPVVNSVLQPDRSYNFRPIFAALKPDLTRADIAACVLETPLSQKAGDYYTGYPEFLSPGALADGLQWAGIDIVFTAHNHCLDRRFAGIQTTLDYLDRIGLAYVGTRSSPDRPRFTIRTVKDIKMAFLSYTTTTNGISLPEGRGWAVNYFDFGKIAADIDAAKNYGADCIVLALHTGIEYQRLPTGEQVKITDRLLAMGVDIIIGSHVHVIEPWERRLVAVSGPNGPRSCLVAYSLGNLLSNQRWRFSDCGLMLTITLQKKTDGPGVHIAGVVPTPLWVCRSLEKGRYRYQILKIDSPFGPIDRLDLNSSARRRIREVWEETFQLESYWQQKRFGHK